MLRTIIIIGWMIFKHLTLRNGWGRIKVLLPASFICFSLHWNYHWKINHFLLFVDSVIQITSHINISIWLEGGAFLSRDRHSSYETSRSRKHLPGYCYSSVTLTISLETYSRKNISIIICLQVKWKWRDHFHGCKLEWLVQINKNQKALFHHVVNCLTFCNFISVLLCWSLQKCSCASKL